ncbi:ubiquitin carboxyl-terminal hydrolase 51-like [Hydractinia symbiolongicarpus]|uniref:ubiquitin carboxyl-terminal hydrolase 51-like n=1 Tax=Hydractinia symbiolongicarpus TaxID=13093 RepID=UPI00254A98E1|nr:ubiquitin carboxyl-terminal hydrolase 51-like [Hydractinia symbiolongicarpus]
MKPLTMHLVISNSSVMAIVQMQGCSITRKVHFPTRCCASRAPETKKHLKVSFVKAGSYSSAKRSKPTGLFHHASDWVMLADLNEGFVFPGHIAITSLRPDIVIYSNCSKRIIIIELTCPCEENMGSWHSTKLSKYFPLVEVIRSNGWFLHLFAVEVGARGYSSRSLTCCLKSLGFASKSAFLTARKLGDISMKASFCIWIARDSPHWSQDLTHCSPPTLPRPKDSIPHEKSSSVTKSNKSPSSAISDMPKPTEHHNLSQELKQKVSIVHAGLINKGNTCYANSILQALTVLPRLWSQLPTESSLSSPLVKSIVLNMSLLNRSRSPIDPSNFLRALQNRMHALNNNAFYHNHQQDVPEILQVVFDEIIGSSPLVDNLLSVTVTTTTSCNSCCFSTSREQKDSILILPTCKSIADSFNKFLQPQELLGDNKWFCPQCSSHQEATIETQISNCGDFLVVQLLRYTSVNGSSFKDNKLVNCLPKKHHVLKVASHPTDDVSFNNKYNLVATINHSGTLKAGHYWAFIKDQQNTWFKCNDRCISQVDTFHLNNSSSYILFFSRS